MVTQQILVLSFWVRIPAAQPEKGGHPQGGATFFWMKRDEGVVRMGEGRGGPLSGGAVRTPFYPEGASVGTHPKVSRKFPGALERTRGPPIPKRPIGTARSLLPKSVADARSRAVAGGPPCQCPGQCLTPEPSAGTATSPSSCRNPSPAGVAGAGYCRFLCASGRDSRSHSCV